MNMTLAITQEELEELVSSDPFRNLYPQEFQQVQLMTNGLYIERNANEIR